MRILLVNGPPRVGKDTVGDIIIQKGSFNCYQIGFANCLKVRTHALYGLEDFGGTLRYNFFEKTKDEPFDFFYGLTPRQAYIEVSERLMKPVHGDDIWGRILLKKLQENRDAELVVITDSGFEPEAEVLIDHYGAQSVELVRLHMPGVDFTGDSRSYIELEFQGVRCHDIESIRGDLDGLAKNLQDALPWLELKL